MWRALAFLWVIPLAGQTSIMPADVLGAFRWVCAAGGAMQRVPVDGQEFAEALRLSTPSNISTGTDREWSCRIRHSLTVPVAANDWLVAVYWIRAIEQSSEPAQVKLSFERNAPDYRKSVSSGTIAARDWRRMQVPFRLVEAYQPGGAMLDFWLGYDPQTIEIGGISILNYGPSAAPPVPTLGFTYPGREMDAEWRVAAQERIEKHRKADLTVQVTDAAGNPVEGAQVRLRMKRHAFGFGTAVAAVQLLGTSADSNRYREKIRELFNKTVLENDLKWPGWEQDRQRAMNALRWLHDNGLPDVRGHNMVWPNWQFLPADVLRLAGDPDALRRRIDDHILDIGAATRGWVTDWDVVNEPIPNRVLQQILGDNELIRWFQLARRVDPDVRLFINEYDIETGGGRNTQKQQQYFDMIQGLLDGGAPLTGIGIQGHFGTDLTDPQKVYNIIDRYTVFGLPVQITEFDINTNDEQLQADYTRDYMTVVFSHPGVDALLIWGFWEGRHWRPEAALYRRNWEEKPNGRVWRELIFGEWWTNAEGQSNAAGVFTSRGFLGAYEVEVERDGVVLTRPFTLTRDARPLEVVF